MNLGKALVTIGGWTMLSRITGQIRETLMASYLGAGLASDAFVVAFRFPNLFRSLFAEGAFNPAFVPLFAGHLDEGGPDAARQFAEQCLAVLTCTVLVFVAAMEIAMPWAVYVLAPGFGDLPGKIELATELSRITFPYLLFISAVSLQSGVLNALGRFAAAAGTPVLLNITSVAVLVSLAPYTPTPAHAMAWGVFASGVAQFLWLVVSVQRADMPLHLVRPRLSPEVVRMLRRILPGAVGAGAYQINIAINTILASLVADGAASYLYYAERLNQLPVGVVGVAMGTALLPMLTRQLKTGQAEAAQDSQNRAMELTLLLTVPSALGLMVLAHPIIAVVYQYGAFSIAKVAPVASALVALTAGLPAYVLIKVLAPGFFAREDTKTPVKVAMAAMAANFLLNLALMGSLRHVGIALATAASAWINAGTLAWLLHRRGHLVFDRRLRRRVPRILLAGAIMATPLMAAATWLAPVFYVGGTFRIAVLAAMVVLGALLYAGAALALGATHLGEVRSTLGRKRS
jgi:putative peptidoglycan lipid II flippase